MTGCYKLQIISIMFTVCFLSVINSSVNLFETQLERAFVFYFENFKFMCLVDSGMLINFDHYQNFFTVFIFNELEFYMVFTLDFTKILFNLISNSYVKDHYKIPVLNGFSCFLRKVLFSKFSK